MMMSRDRRRTDHTTTVTTRQAHIHVQRAERFLWLAGQAYDAGYFAEAAANAVEAGIHAADAVCGFLSHTHWTGPHNQAATYADSLGPEGKQIAKHLRRLLAKKTQVQYEAIDLGKLQADTHLEAARKSVAIASQLADRRRGS